MGDIDPIKEVEAVIENLDKAHAKLKETSQGRVYNVGTKIVFKDKFGIVTDLNQGSEDPTGSTVDIRLDDGTTVDNVSVTSTALKLFRQ